MTDREYLELAAKAAGIPLKPDFAERYDYYMADKLMWNPITDDGDALRLAVKLKMNIHLDSNMVDVDPDGVSWFSEAYLDDPYAATRRAIVRAAAEIGKNL